MKKYFLLFALLFLSACSGPPIWFKDLDGNAMRLSDFQGKWVVINYWGSWCKPCWEEIPALNDFYRAHKGKVIVLGVNKGDPPNQLRAIVKKMGIEFPVLTSDPGLVSGYPIPTVFPATYVVPPSGDLQPDILPGPQTRESLERAICR